MPLYWQQSDYNLDKQEDSFILLLFVWGRRIATCRPIVPTAGLIEVARKV